MHRPALAGLVCVGLLAPAPAGAATEPAYLDDWPSGERVLADHQGTDRADTMARQMAALHQLSLAIDELAGPRRWRAGLTADEQRLRGQYYDAAEKIRSEAHATLSRYLPAGLVAQFDAAVGSTPEKPDAPADRSWLVWAGIGLITAILLGRPEPATSTMPQPPRSSTPWHRTLKRPAPMCGAYRSGDCSSPSSRGSCCSMQAPRCRPSMRPAGSTAGGCGESRPGRPVRRGLDSPGVREGRSTERQLRAHGGPGVRSGRPRERRAADVGRFRPHETALSAPATRLHPARPHAVQLQQAVLALFTRRLIERPADD